MKLSSVEAAVMEALEQVIDPELGIDIVNLGLIYGVEVNTGKCQIKMTLTTQGCPLSDILHQDIVRQVKKIKDIQSVDVQLVWYPVWTVEKMSRYAWIALGMERG